MDPEALSAGHSICTAPSTAQHRCQCNISGRNHPGNMDAKLQFPGLSNTWTMPVQNRLDMQLTGIKTPLGIKIQGKDVEGIQAVGAKIEQILARQPDVRAVFAERVSQGFYINIEVNR